MSRHADTPRHRLRLTRNAVAIESARAATAFTGSHAEVVVFDEGHAFVAASSDGQGAMLPRDLYLAERRLLDDRESTLASAGGWTAVSIRDCSGKCVGALTIELAEPTELVDGLGSLVRMIEAELNADEQGEADFYEEVVRGQRDAVVVLADDLTLKWVSEGSGTLIGRTPQELIGLSAVDLLHPNDIEPALDAIVRFSQGLELYRVNVRLLNSANVYTPVEITGTDLSHNPIVNGMVLSLRDAQREMEQDLTSNRSRRMSDAIVSSLRDGVLATDEWGTIVKVNNMAREMFSIDENLTTARLQTTDFHLVTIDGRPHNPFSASSTTSPVCCTILPNGDALYLTTSTQPITDGSTASDDERHLGQVIVFSDITSEYRASEELRDQALHDQLTGLANRRQLENRLKELADAAADINIAACFIDLDNFKIVNDLHGHRTGDQLVQVAAERLTRQLRPTDLLVRQGGDEFVALLVGTTDLADATNTAERCRTALAAPYMIDSQQFDLTCSIGVALSAGKELQPTQLLQHADLALYAAKDNGRNAVECFDAALSRAVSNAEAQRKRLRRALEDDELVVHLQPLVSTETERTIGYEALLRIAIGGGDFLLPGPFIENVSSTSLMWELDCAAFELSCQAAALLSRIDRNRKPVISCNFSPVSVNHSEFLPMLRNTVDKAGVDPSQISIELTEVAAFDVGARRANALENLVELGFGLALDDFGTGYSSLAHLRDLPISSLKVDKSFATKLSRGDSERSIAEAIVNVARQLDIDVVAEGVETADQLRNARELGFQIIQGWYYARAMPLASAIQNWTEAGWTDDPIQQAA